MADEHGLRAHARRECSRHVVTACRYIDAHYDEAISVARLAGLVGCSRRYLSERFRREIGETVHGYLTRVRLNHAVGDVRAGSKVEAVMLGVGIRGKANFYRAFKARFGATPAEFASVSSCLACAEIGGEGSMT